MEWIKIKDQMPDEGQTIVVLFENKAYVNGELHEKTLNPCLGKHYKDNGWLESKTNEYDDIKVITKAIAWIPLPDYRYINNNEQ